MANKKTLVALTDTMRMEIAQIRQEDGNTFSDVVRQALRDYIDKRKTARMLEQTHKLTLLQGRAQIIGEPQLQESGCG